MACHCARGWICELHPDQPHPHFIEAGECRGAGRPCENPQCLWWKGNDPEALQPPGTSIEHVDEDRHR